MGSETLIYLLLLAADVAVPGTGWVDIARLVVPAIVAYLVARMQMRKEQRVAQTSLEEKTHQQLAAQQERLTGSWESLTAQARETVARALADAGESAVARRVAEQRADTLSAELAALRAKYDQAIVDLEAMREKVRRRARAGSGT